MAPKQDEPTTPTNDNYEPQPVDNVSEFTEPATSVDSTSSPADNTTATPLDSNDSATDVNSSQPTDVSSETPTEPAVASQESTTASSETQTTYVNPDNQAALTGATATGGMSTLGQPPKKSRGKRVLVGVIIGLVIVLAVLAGLWFWYNSTSKVMGDAVNQLLAKPISSSQGDFNIADQSNGDVKLTGNFSTKQAADKSSELTMKLNFQGKGADVQVPLDVIAASNGDLYVKVSQVKQLLSDLLTSQNATPAQIQQAQTYFGGLINKVDDKWIKISKQELEDLTKQAGQSDQADISCAQTALQQFYGSAAQQNEIKKAFADHPLFTVDKQLGSKDIDGHNSQGYSLSSDNAKADAFSKAVADSQLAKNLKKCGSFSDTSSSDSSSSSSNPTVHAEAWVDRWNHQFTELSLSVKDKTTDVAVNLKPSFDKPVAKIDVPSNATTITELKTQLQQTLGGLMMAEMSSQSSTTTLQ